MREKLIVLIQSAVGGCSTYWAGLIADFLIANGVTIPVRCKECKHCKATGIGYRWCTAWERIQTMGDDGFCNFGERRTDE